MTAETCDGKFDAHIVAVFDEPGIEVDPTTPSPKLLWMHKNHRHPVDMKAHWMLMASRAATEDAPKFLMQIGDILADVPEPMLDAVLNGRVKMTMLLNQNGGNGMAQHCLEGAMLNVYENGGEVQSIVTHRAYSLAAHLTEFCSKRIAFPSSEFLWHAIHDGNGVSIGKSVDECTDANMEMFRNTIDSAYVPHMRACFRQAIEDEDNPLNDVVLKGARLRAWGYVHELVSCTAVAKRLFEADIGQEIDFDQWKHDPIARFFLRSQMEEYALIHGLRVQFLNRRHDRFGYQIPVKQRKEFSDEQIDTVMSLTKKVFKKYF